MRRAARAARRARLPAARRRLHLGHRPVADDDAVGARGDVRRRRARPARRGRAAPARPPLPDPLGGRGRSTSTSSATATRLRAEVAKFSPRDAARLDAVPRRAARRSTSDGDPRRGPARRSRRRATSPRFMPTMVRLGARAAAVRASSRALRAPARARGVLVPLAVHRRRPVPRAGDLRRARVPAVRRRRLVRRRRRLLGRRGDGARRSTCAAASAVERDRARAAGA